MKQHGFLCAVLWILHGNAWAAIQPTSTRIIQISISESTPVKKGKCWTESVATPRKDAWRCMLDNDIYDPCFSTRSAKSVVCGVDPAKNEKGFTVALEEPLPKASISRKLTKPGMYPLQLRLTDGTNCAPFTGTRMLLGKETIDYGCQNNACSTPESCQVGILSIDRQNPLWIAKVVVYTVQKEGQIKVKSLQKVPVQAVWE